MKNKGFTLLELLVVIGIISIMMALTTVAYSTAQRSGRDARRKQDLVAMQNALEQYYSANAFVYPTTCSNAGTDNLKSGWPVDPTNAGDYTYTQNCNETDYCICATMEKDTAGNSSGVNCSSWATPGPYYCVANLQ